MEGSDKRYRLIHGRGRAGASRARRVCPSLYSQLNEAPSEPEQERKLVDLALRLGVPYLRLSAGIPCITVARYLPAEGCRRRLCAPVAQDSRVLTVAMADPTDSSALQWLADKAGNTIYPVLSSSLEVSAVLDRMAAFQRLREVRLPTTLGVEVMVGVSGLRSVGDLLEVVSWLEHRFDALCVSLPKSDGDSLAMRVPDSAGRLLLRAIQSGKCRHFTLRGTAARELDLEFRRL